MKRRIFLTLLGGAADLRKGQGGSSIIGI